MSLSNEIIACLRRALEEDVGSGDVTTDSIVPRGANLRGKIVAKQRGVVAGLDIAGAVFSLLDGSIEFAPVVAEGAEVESGTVLAVVSGSARALLTGERTALNFILTTVLRAPWLGLIKLRPT